MKRWAAVALVLLLLAEVPVLYAAADAQASPTSETVTATEYAYSAGTNFSYEANLVPNPVFNGTTLGPGQGTLFTALVRSIDLTYTYSVALSAPAAVTGRTAWTLVVDGGLWNRTLNYTVLGPGLSVGSTTSFALSGNVSVNLTAVATLVRTIDNATDFSPLTYQVVLRPIEYVAVSPPGLVPIDLLATPQFNLTVGPTVITPGGLGSTASGSRSTTTVETLPATATWRLLTIVAATILGMGATVAAYFTAREAILDRRRNVVARRLREMTSPYQEAIAMTGTPPTSERMVGLGTWEGLVRVADMLGKPILRYERPATDGEERHLFYVIDGSTQYAYLLPRAKELLAEHETADHPPR